jgi:NifU-like N terminal domain
MSPQSRYPPLVWNLFVQAPLAGGPSNPAGWFQGEATEPLSGTRVRVYLAVADGCVRDLCYEVRGCPYTVAAAAIVATRWLGQPTGAVSIEPRRLLSELTAPIAKLGRMLVVEDAYRRALQAAGQTA